MIFSLISLSLLMTHGCEGCPHSSSIATRWTDSWWSVWQLDRLGMGHFTIQFGLFSIRAWTGYTRPLQLMHKIWDFLLPGNGKSDVVHHFVVGTVQLWNGQCDSLSLSLEDKGWNQWPRPNSLTPKCGDPQTIDPIGDDCLKGNPESENLSSSDILGGNVSKTSSQVCFSYRIKLRSLWSNRWYCW